jgi:DNA repair exonuclease SbcCD ATPase subunit
MNIWLIIACVIAAPFFVYSLYQYYRGLSKAFNDWIAKLDRIKQREETLERKEKNFMDQIQEQNSIVWREKDKAMEQYQAALAAIKISEEIRRNTQAEMEELKAKIASLEKQLHHSRQRGVRLSEKSKKAKEV